MRGSKEVHAAHCCPIHGCKYSYGFDVKCPIVDKQIEPKYEMNNGCEECWENNVNNPRRWWNSSLNDDFSGIVGTSPYTGLTILNAEGEEVFGFCLRDDTVELRALPDGEWYRIDRSSGTINLMKINDSHYTNCANCNAEMLASNPRDICSICFDNMNPIHVWQACPVCYGRKVVPGNFYGSIGLQISTPCETCNKTGIIDQFGCPPEWSKEDGESNV